MAKKTESKMTTKELLDKCIEAVEYTIPWAIGIGAIFGFDIAVYVSAIAGVIVAVLRLIEVFLKD
ncbi:MAG: hypothetical protein II453_04130 [Alphaproteobacteria bacterium]|nr:hypothetical protein [Alphaproteobacteria bacterium]